MDRHAKLNLIFSAIFSIAICIVGCSDKQSKDEVDQILFSSASSELAARDATIPEWAVRFGSIYKVQDYWLFKTNVAAQIYESVMNAKYVPYAYKNTFNTVGPDYNGNYLQESMFLLDGYIVEGPDPAAYNAIRIPIHIEGPGHTFTDSSNPVWDSYGDTVPSKNAHIEGSFNTLHGTLSYNAHIEGISNEARGIAVHAEGDGNKVFGLAAHVEGNNNKIGSNSDDVSYFSNAHAEGGLNEIVKSYSKNHNGIYVNYYGAFSSQAHIEGLQNIVGGVAAHGEGTLTIAFGNGAHAEGSGVHSEWGEYPERRTIAYGNGAHAEGVGTWAGILNGSVSSQGAGAHAEGYTTTSGGMAAHAEGYASVAQGIGAHAEGVIYEGGDNGWISRGVGDLNTERSTIVTEALKNGAHAEGVGTKAYGMGSHSEGILTESGSSDTFGTHAEGIDTKALGQAAHSEGSHTEARGSHSHAEGYGSYANGAMSHVAGFMAHDNYYDGTWVWQGGGVTAGSYTYYYSHGVGTFNINPMGGTAGVWIGETNLQDCIRAEARKMIRDALANVNVNIQTAEDTRTTLTNLITILKGI